MAGHGRLCQRISRSRCTRPATGLLCAGVLAALATSQSISSASESDALVDARLHLQLESKDARFWNVRLKVIDAATPIACISELENHSSSDNTTGALELSTDARTLAFQPRHAMSGGAVRFRVRASREAKLVIESIDDVRNKTPSLGQSAAKELPLAEILRQKEFHSHSREAGGASGGTGTWTLTRVAGDQLRIENIREVPVYESGSPLEVTVHTNGMTHHASRSLTLEYSLYRVSHGQTVSSHRWPITVDAHGNSESISIDEAVPEAPGVYEIRCQVTRREDTIWSRLRRQDPPIMRVSRPIIVRSNLPPSRPGEGEPWHEVGVIRPSESSWSVGQWLPKQTSRLIPGTGRQPTGPQNADLASGEYAGQSVSLIGPQQTFQATLPVMTPGLPHKVTIRFPHAGITNLRIDVGSADDRAHPAVSFVLASDPVTEDEPDRWKTHTFLHYPAGDDQVWVTNLDTDKPAKFESIFVQAGPNRLALLTPPQPRQRTTVLKLAGIDWVDSLSRDVQERTASSSCDPSTLALYKLWIASDRLRDYAAAMSISSILVPANSAGTTWFESELFFPRRDASVGKHAYLATFMRLMEGSNLGVFVGLRPDMLLAGPERSMRTQPVSARRLTRGHNGNRVQYNPLDPFIQESLASLVGELCRQCSGYVCFAGIALQCDPQSHLYASGKLLDEPGSLTLLAESQGVTLSPARLPTWAGQQDKNVLEAWLRNQMQHAQQRIAESAAGKTVLMVIDGSDHSLGLAETNDLAIQPLAGPRQSGLENLVPAQSFQYGPPRILAEEALLQHKLSSTSGPTGGAVVLAHRQTDEAVLVRGRLMADATRIIDRLDPSVVVVEFPLFAHRLPDDFAQMLHRLTMMPAKMRTVEPVDSAAQTVHLRLGSKDGHLYIAMTSLAPWTSAVDLETSTPIDWVPVNNMGGSDPTVSIQQTTQKRASVVVPAGQLVVLRSKTEGSGATIKHWSTRVSGGAEALEQIKRKVTLVVERIGVLSDMNTYDGLANGGFERSGGMGLVGWLHAQHPPGCVRVDDRESLEGEHSVLLTTDASTMNRTWIVSETIDPPRSGRLAVSLACRAELKNDGSDHRLRVSIEATRNRVPVRHSSEVNVPRNGQWVPREIVLEADGIHPGSVDSLRLTIDSLSGGRVWMDDIRLHDQFPTAKERAELQSQAFLAVQGLQRGNLTPSGRLLQNQWARYLLTLDPPEELKPVIENDEPVEEAPGVAERIRSWLPSPLRF